MNIEMVRQLKNHIVLYTVLILLLMALMHNANAQLKVFDRNPNYLTYNGEVIFLACSVPLGNDFHVEDFKIEHLHDMKTYGGNHVWIMIENFTREKWTYVTNTPDPFWEKMELICKTAYENDIIVGISLFGYGLVKYPWMYSFNAACKGHCDEVPGPLLDPYDFYDVNKYTPEVVEARDAQKYIMRKIVDYTWDYPNVYYSQGWELNCIWNTNVAQWYRWSVDFMKDYGAEVNPNVTHLFAIEKTTTPMEARTLGADFVVEEDGNTQKEEGIPYVFWSMDGVYRGEPFWNGDLEPRYNWDYTREMFLAGAAGIASNWGTNIEEKEYIKCITDFAKTIENWSDEPGQEIIDSAVPETSTVAGIDLPGSAAQDFVDYSAFQITNLTVSSGSPFEADYAVYTGGPYYTDRDYGLYFIPPDFQGLVWLKTPNADKRLSDDPYLSYSINTEATIYVGYDSRLSVKPAWLSDWTNTGKNVIDTNGVEFELMRKDFPAGEVQMGANYGDGSSCSMYIILHKPTGDIDLTPPAIPTNVTLSPLFN